MRSFPPIRESYKNFDAFAFIASGAVDLGTGPAWSSDTARGTGAGTTELELYNGVWVNKNAITLRFGTASGDTVSVAARQATHLGSFRCTANGQTEDSLTKRFLFNAYNRRRRAMRRLESTTSWTYSTASYQQANAAAANQLDFLIGLSEEAVTARLRATCENGTGGAILAQVALGLDSVSAAAAGATVAGFSLATATRRYQLGAEYSGYPGLGRHYLAWLEKVTATGTTTWYGASENGLQGEVHA